MIIILELNTTYAWLSAKCWRNQMNKMVTVLMEIKLVREVRQRIITAQCDKVNESIVKGA